MKITSTAFVEGKSIPEKYSKYGQNQSPPLLFEDIPENTRSLAMIMDDPDAPNGTFTHWLIFNLDPAVAEIKENSTPPDAIEGINDYGESGYGGPKPPSGTHRYFFKLFALDTQLKLPDGVSRARLEREISKYTIASAQLMGTYTRKEK